MASQANLRVLSPPSNDSTNASATLRLVNKLIGAAELLKPGQPLDDFARELMVGLWAKTCSEVGEAAFQTAWRSVLDKSTYRPDIAEIRRFLGLLTEPPAEVEAFDALKTIVAAMRKHGPKLKAIQSSMRLPPEVPAPVFPDLIEGAIEDLGCGDRGEGLSLIFGSHPALEGTRRQNPNYEPQDAKFNQKSLADLERRWLRNFLQCRSKGLPCTQ